MARVRVNRKSFLTRAALVEQQVEQTIYQFWDLQPATEIVELDGDAFHTVTSFDRIDSLARRYYGDSRLWWVIAEANGMEDPVSSLHIGLKIRIPSPRYVLERVVR